jgi:hypothetical protein
LLPNDLDLRDDSNWKDPKTNRRMVCDASKNSKRHGFTAFSPGINSGLSARQVSLGRYHIIVLSFSQNDNVLTKSN